MDKYEIIIYWSEEDQLFISEVPELQGCIAHGDSREESLRQVHLAIKLWLDTAKEFGRPHPQPKGRKLLYA